MPSGEHQILGCGVMAYLLKLGPQMTKVRVLGQVFYVELGLSALSKRDQGPAQLLEDC